MNFEKLGSFYLGKEVNVADGRLLDQPLMYDARDLTTHAVCVGMTGSGKTGLCIDLLEEAAIDRVPALILDPKGDITNLLLQFPDLLPSDFRPWINPEDARRKGLSLDQFAEAQAQTWREGLKEWGQDGDRIRLLNESAEFTIYTPGSDAGVPISILHSLKAPEISWDENSEQLRERIQGTVTALLSLLGMDCDPIKSREHILLSSLLEDAWKQNKDLDLRLLIQSIQNPPIRQVGVFDVETFYPQKDRFELAMSLNNVIASPSFAGWMEGQPLDINTFLANSQGKPRHSIFYLAHLSESERSFFVTILLNQVISWMRTQPGTTSLRALVYMDEIFGFFPPVANPPSKKPMLTLLKQARAYGVGLVLATQNPIDLDYKGLTNAGTWFIGRLQTDRDKKRVLDGLEGASSQSGTSLDREDFDQLISNLGKRVFLLHNVNEEKPVVFQTRWAMSFLRGPLTKQQIRQLEKKDSVISNGGAEQITAAKAASSEAKVSESSSTLEARYLDAPPAVAPGIEQVFLPVTKNVATALNQESLSVTLESEEQLVYRPAVLATGRVHFVDRRRNVSESEEVCLLSEVSQGPTALRWEDARLLEGETARFLEQPESPARFDTLPDSVNEARDLDGLKKDLEDFLYRTKCLNLLHCPALGEYSLPKETERDFRLRLTQLSRERRDDEVDKLSSKYEKKLRSLQDQLRKAELALEKKESTAQARSREVLFSVGEGLIGMFMGRRSLRSASSSLGKYRMSSTAKIAVSEAEEKVESLKRDAAALEEELQEQVKLVTETWDKTLEEFEQVPVTPRRSDIEVDLVALAWEPFWFVSGKDDRGLRLERSIKAS